MKVAPTPIALKHYKDGDFHKDYDRQMTVTSIVNFMRDPAGDLPWDEDPIGADVYHIQDAVVRKLKFFFRFPVWETFLFLLHRLWASI